MVGTKRSCWGLKGNKWVAVVTKEWPSKSLDTRSLIFCLFFFFSSNHVATQGAEAAEGVLRDLNGPKMVVGN